ncbi:14205_t:CDS:2, partial [Entrophospora sp. SA101]
WVNNEPGENMTSFPFTVNQQNDAQKKLVEFMINNVQPFSLVTSETFKRFVASLNILSEKNLNLDLRRSAVVIQTNPSKNTIFDELLNITTQQISYDELTRYSSIANWYNTLCNNNSNYKLLRRPNRTWLIRDDSSNLEVLEYHNNLQITETPENNYYNLLTVEGCDIDIDQKTYVPILPGYSIITNIGGSYIRFTIKKNEQNLLYFAWYDYGNDSTLTSEEHSYSGTHFFNTFNDYIQKKRKGKWSTPNLLGLNIKENVEFLCNKICHHYPSIFNDCKQIQTATKKTNTLINAMKRKGDQLIKEIESGVENDNNINENQTNIKEGIIIKSKGINVTPTEAQAALVKFRERDRLFHQEKKKYKRAMETVTKLQEKLSEKNTLDYERQLKIKELATQAINSSQVGSTIIVDTCNYVKIKIH